MGRKKRGTNLILGRINYGTKKKGDELTLGRNERDKVSMGPNEWDEM